MGDYDYHTEEAKTMNERDAFEEALTGFGESASIFANCHDKNAAVGGHPYYKKKLERARYDLESDRKRVRQQVRELMGQMYIAGLLSCPCDTIAVAKPEEYNALIEAALMEQKHE